MAESASFVITTEPIEDDGIRYVSIHGDDENDGLTPVAAKRSPEAAIASLPETGSGAQKRHSGKVVFGSGTFETSAPLEWNAELEYVGVGTGIGGTKILRCHDGHVFEKTSTFDDWNHHMRVRSLRIDGNKANYSAVADLIHAKNGGFNTALYDVMLANSSGRGYYATHAVDTYFYNCTGAGCDDSWLRVDLAASANEFNLGIFGAQIDNCGSAPIHIEDHSDGGANVLMIYGLETEAIGAGAGLHDHVVCIDTIEGVNPIFVIADGISAYRQDGAGDAVCKRTGLTGTSPRWSLRSIHGSGYDLAFHDAKTGQASVLAPDNHIYHQFWSDGSHGPQLGNVVWLSGSQNPEGTQAAPPGSLFSHSNGRLYLKTAGTDATGWREVELSG